ncbi:MAG: glycerol-3-phosphate 1-O-acyltransferase PlsY [Pseudomonadota bacterium]
MGVFLLSIALGYLLGSAPFGLIITRAAGLGDIRAVGSGNIGATNVLRTGRKDLALATLLLDGGKGAIAVGIAAMLGWRPEIAGAAAFLGHCFPVWLGFKGGKGVATFFGTLLAIWFPGGVLACLTWLLTAAVSKYSSLSALVAAAGAPAILFAMGRPSPAGAALFMAAIIFIRHKANIDRLIRGEEPRIGADKKEADEKSADGTNNAETMGETAASEDTSAKSA